MQISALEWRLCIFYNLKVASEGQNCWRNICIILKIKLLQLLVHCVPILHPRYAVPTVCYMFARHNLYKAIMQKCQFRQKFIFYLKKLNFLFIFKK